MSDSFDPEELHYTHKQLAVMLGNRGARWVIEEIRAGHFGAEVVKDGADYLVPVSAVKAWRAARRFVPQVDLKPIRARARTAGLRRGTASLAVEVGSCPNVRK